MLLRAFKSWGRIQAGEQSTDRESKSILGTWDKLPCSIFQTYQRVKFYYTQAVDDRIGLGEVTDGPQSPL